MRSLGPFLLFACLAVPACRRSDAPPGSTEARSPAAALAPAAAASDAGEAVPRPAADAGAPDAVPPAAAPRAGCPGVAAQRIPTSPDPLGGRFALPDALAGLAGGDGPLRARIATTAGTLECALDADRAPQTVANFVGLARGVRPWWDPCRGAWVREPLYDGMRFHRLEAAFVAQAGCPIGDGTGGPGYAIPDEIRREALRHDAAGVLSMANVGPDTAGSQFFVTLAATPELDRRYAVFGRCGPAEVLQRLDAAARQGTEVRIERVIVERAGAARAGGAP